MTAEQMWESFTRETGIQAAYEAWPYGAAPDELAQLTLDGVKTATASAYDLYLVEGEPIPQPGQYSVVLDAAEQAVCVIRTEQVSVVPFSRVTQRQAWKEGEGDRSLAYWRRVHEEFFRMELAAIGLSFSEEMLVVCEEFTKVFP